MNLIEKDIVANGVRLHVHDTECDRPPLVFAHGITDNGLCFMPFAEQLTDDFRIILYDSRNHGKSEASESLTTFLDRVHDLAGLLDALGLEKPGLVGHSMGALTVALFAGLYCDVPHCVVLEDPPPFEMFARESSQSQDGHNVWRDMAVLNKQKSIQELIEINRQESPTWPEAERLPWAQSKQQVSLKVFDEDRIGVDEGKQIVSQITCPVLLLTADLDKHSLYPPRSADELVASLPMARHVNIRGAGHSIRREQPGAYLKAVRDFLEEFS